MEFPMISTPITANCYLYRRPLSRQIITLYRTMGIKGVFFMALMLLGLLPPAKKTTIWLVGDSTMANKELKAYPETGWGMPFATFFDSTVVVDNRAKNGRSTKSFIAEGRWDAALKDMKAGDW